MKQERGRIHYCAAHQPSGESHSEKGQVLDLLCRAKISQRGCVNPTERLLLTVGSSCTKPLTSRKVDFVTKAKEQINYLRALKTVANDKNRSRCKSLTLNFLLLVHAVEMRAQDKPESATSNLTTF